MHSQRKNTIIRNTVTYLFVFFIATVALTARSQKAQQVINKLSLPNKSYNLKFTWQGDSVNNSFETHSAILIAVKLKGCPKTFYMQFDLGSPYSLLYKNKLQTIIATYPQTKAQVTGSNTASATLKLGTMEIDARSINLRDFGSAEIDFNTKKPQIIGTLGVDLFDGKILVIDYPNQKITINAEIPATYKKENFSPFIYAQRSILLPTVLTGKKTLLFFDTGSSRYSLLTNEKTAKAMAKENQQPITTKVSSWDRVLTANTLFTDATITIAGQNLPLKQVTYMQGASSAQIDMMMKMGIEGMTGNKLFLLHQLILDTKNKKFALVRKK